MIHILPQQLINKIAAGEVVERPASVIKELIENALDAGATQISIEIEQGGKKLIKVTDNGSGMDKADLERCIQPHATSKISQIDDLYRITSFGFRGEALSSISAVSQFSLISQTKDQTQGHVLKIDQTDHVEIQPTAATTGTSVSCKNLFYNIPARQKFLKNPNTEFSHILNTFIALTLINPKIVFTLTHNHRTTKQLPVREKWSQRVADLLGKEFPETLLSVDFKTGDYFARGFISAPRNVEVKPKNQYIFINNRPVKDFLILKAIRSAYEGIIPDRNQPNVIFAIRINPKKADVNVHPRKMEVKHENPGEVFAFVKAACRRALAKSVLNLKSQSVLDKPLAAESSPYGSISLQNFYPKSRTSLPLTKGETKRGFINDYRKPPLNPLLGKEGQTGAPSIFKNDDNGRLPLTNDENIRSLHYRLLGQIHKSYLVIENDNGLLLIDQHAAAERINFEKLSLQIQQNGSAKKQLLTLPINLELSLKEKNVLINHLDTLNELGFEIEPFGGNTYKITAVPANLKIKNPIQLIKDIIYDLEHEFKPKTVDNIKKAMTEIIACRSAVKFGDALALEEQIALIEALNSLPNNQSCPHGRPVFYQLSMEDLEKMFKRR